MKSQVRFTQKQITAMHDFVSGKALGGLDGKKSNLMFLYNLNTPKDIYVKYTSYGVNGSNSIGSELTILCISEDGKLRDCYEQFSSVNEKMAFASDFIEIELDKQGKMVIL